MSFSSSRNLLLHHRNIALDLYSAGDQLRVVEAELSTLGLAVCADNFGSPLAIGYVLACVGAQVILLRCRSRVRRKRRLELESS